MEIYQNLLTITKSKHSVGIEDGFYFLYFMSVSTFQIFLQFVCLNFFDDKYICSFYFLDKRA